MRLLSQKRLAFVLLLYHKEFSDAIKLDYICITKM